MKPLRRSAQLLLVAFCLFSCQTAPMTSPTTIDIDQGLKNTGELRLSEIASDVEFVQLRGMNADTYVHSWSWQYFVGEKVIAVFNLKPFEFLLFLRDGRFIRKIGNAGKGPGEFMGDMLVFSVDEERETILLADNQSKKFLLYRFTGELIKEQAYKNYHGLSVAYAVGITTDGKGNYVVKNQIFPTGSDICYNLLLIGPDLKLVQAMHPEQVAKGSNFIGIGSNPVYRIGKGIRYWTYSQGIVFELIDDRPVPVYHFRISDIPSTVERMTSDNRGKTEVSKILETSSYLFIEGSTGSKPFYLAHQKTTGKTIRILAKGKCVVPIADQAGIENDLFGYSPVTLTGATICQGKLIITLHPGMVDFIEESLKGKLTDCLRAASALLPGRRDELVRLIENFDDNSGPVVMVVSLK